MDSHHPQHLDHHPDSKEVMVQNLFWATGNNLIALPLAAGILYKQSVLLSPAAGAVLMSISTVIVAINASQLKIK
jgi:Cu2+-exporting ATPase